MKGVEQDGSCLECSSTIMNEIFTNEDLCLINANKSNMYFEGGETILKQGSFVSQIIYLKKGLVKIVLEGKNDRNSILSLVEAENFIALQILGDPCQYPFSVIAIYNCNVCFIREATIIEVMKRNTSANNYLLKWLSNDYLFMYNKILTISTRNSHGKLAAALLYLTSGAFESDALNSISRKELAELASISVESSNKILLQLKHDRIIEIKDNKITIKRRDLIEKLSTIG